MILGKISHHYCNVETTEGFVALCILIVIMMGIAALMDFVRNQKAKKNADFDDIEVSIKIKYGRRESESKKKKIGIDAMNSLLKCSR